MGRALGGNEIVILDDEGRVLGPSEVGLVSLLRDTILDEKDLPIRLVGISPCFRREAGAAGRDTRGLYRVYQFQKVEQVVFTHNDPAASMREHQLILNNAEEILRALGIPHRVAIACGAGPGSFTGLRVAIGSSSLRARLNDTCASDVSSPRT